MDTNESSGQTIVTRVSGRRGTAAFGCRAACEPARASGGRIDGAAGIGPPGLVASMVKKSLGTMIPFTRISRNIQQLFLLPYDSWEGYGADRKEILNFIRDNHIADVIFLTTDYHLNIIGNVALDRFADPQPIAVEFITGPIATVTSEQLTLSLSPPAIAPQALMAQHALYNLAGVESQNLNTYSYGLVEVDANAGTVRVTLKDQNGNAIHDQLNPSILCTK